MKYTKIALYGLLLATAGTLAEIGKTNAYLDETKTERLIAITAGLERLASVELREAMLKSIKARLPQIINKVPEILEITDKVLEEKRNINDKLYTLCVEKAKLDTESTVKQESLIHDDKLGGIKLRLSIELLKHNMLLNEREILLGERSSIMTEEV
ncbi:hypothetical protein HOL34_00025 [bacterium]|jgi:hypothetical protein|nr:hypothetical protein [bacterium]MBT4577977.1 hypothetical protein [bacterium]MBT5345991.1 hypothetical protein [bacterium]MBT6130777.1 hypothetical protein [bacterium]MBT6528487.1 hypothetical protein [bacterium]